ncbi:translation initiation factor IF-2 [Candidatus Woesearchaeota archaeon]|nr:translation initiation factor IF-2 [Candidatus Woesearchaeota archaeon]
MRLIIPAGMTLRSPICSVVGHVDHGKSSILDRIRGTAIVKSEAGSITQAIGASIIPVSTLTKICGSLVSSMNMKFTIPGLLFIDTPGHAAFTNMRKRGGNLADIALVVIDINEGVMPQTVESIDILRHYKTPFIVAANKVDLIRGWKNKNSSLLQNITEQSPETVQELENKMYGIVGKLSEMGFNAERYDRVQDYTKQVAIVPLSASTGEGIAELLMVVAGLAQKFLEECLKCDTNGDARGIIIEVKEEKGIGKCLDAIIHDGTLKSGGPLIIGGIKEPIVTKVKLLLEPEPLSEMRDKKAKFTSVKSASAATGVRISAPDIDDAVAGMPIIQSSNLEWAKEEVQKGVQEVLIETDGCGVIVKADSLGSLEAAVKLLREANVKIKRTGIGNITKNDISDAWSNYESEPVTCAVIGFNVMDSSGSKDSKVKVITAQVIYEILDSYKAWAAAEKKRIEMGNIEHLVSPSKMLILKGYVFRQNNPAVVGIEVLAGKLKAGTPVMNSNGKAVSTVKGIQEERESVNSAEKGKQVAISLPDVTVGRQISEGDVLYSDVQEGEFRIYKEFKKYLSDEQKSLLKEIAGIKRKENAVWGI